MNEKMKNHFEMVTDEVVFVDSFFKRHLSSNDSHQHLANLEINFVCYDEEEEEKVISRVAFAIFDTPANSRVSNSYYNMVVEMDCESAEFGEIASDVCNHSGKLGQKITSEPYLFCLEDIMVADEYRGMGIGSQIMNNLFSLVEEACNLQPTYILFTPFVYSDTDNSDEEKQKELEAVEKFFKNNKCKRLGDKAKAWYLKKGNR